MTVIDVPLRAARPLETALEMPTKVGELCHDLRQHAAAVSMLVAAAAAAPDVPPVIQQRLRQITREAGRLCTIVNDVLARRPVYAPVDVVDLASDVVAGALVTYAGKLTLSVDGSACVLGQRTQLDRALSNLIENAAHAAGATGHVHVGVRTDCKVVYIRVDDDGPGLLGAAGGVSLGLLIVDRVVREHAGSVVVGKSHLGGTRVEMSVPRLLWGEH